MELQLHFQIKQLTLIANPGNKTGSIDQYMKGKKIGLIWGYETIGIAKSQEEMDTHLASLPKGGQNDTWYTMGSRRYYV